MIGFVMNYVKFAALSLIIVSGFYGHHMYGMFGFGSLLARGVAPVGGYRSTKKPVDKENVTVKVAYGSAANLYGDNDKDELPGRSTLVATNINGQKMFKKHLKDIEKGEALKIELQNNGQ